MLLREGGYELEFRERGKDKGEGKESGKNLQITVDSKKLYQAHQRYISQVEEQTIFV